MYLYRTQLLMNQNSKLMLRYRYEISNPWFPPQTRIYVILSINTTINGEMNLQSSSGTSGVL